jgi:hypothetical protein
MGIHEILRKVTKTSGRGLNHRSKWTLLVILDKQEKDSKADHKGASSLCQKASKSSSEKIEPPGKGVSEPKRTDTVIYRL